MKEPGHDPKDDFGPEADPFPGSVSDEEVRTATQIADHLEKTDVEAFAWLLSMEDTHDFEAEDAKDFLVSLLREHARRGLPTKEQIEFAIDHCEPDFIADLKNEREAWIADNMRYEILQRVRNLKAPL